MAPLADAVRFIDDDGLHVPMFAPSKKHGMVQSFRTEVKELGLAESGVVKDSVSIVAHPSFSPNAFCSQAFALVLHQGNQRCDHKAQAPAGERRQLEAQTFSTARRHQRQGVLPAPQPQCRGGLVWTQVLEPPMCVEELEHGLGQAFGSFLVAHAVMTDGLPIFGPECETQK